MVYTSKVMDHFAQPRNVGKMIYADGESTIGDASCGCAAAIATSSVTSELVKGKTIAEALKLTEQDVIDALDGLPPIKYHCSNLAVRALRLAINDYEEKKTKSVLQRIGISLRKYCSSIKNRLVKHMVYRLYKR
jgi:nitrogen fixation NifU-like protein